MLKQLLTELKEVIECLENAGYFEQPKEAPRKERAKGYQVPPREKGRKLTRAEALDIFHEDRLSVQDIAQIFNVTESTVYQIKEGYTWWKVTGKPQRKFNKTPARRPVLPGRAVSTHP